MRQVHVGDFLLPRFGYNRDYERVRIVTKINNKSYTVKPWVYGSDTSYIKKDDIDSYAILTNDSIARHFSSIFKKDLEDMQKLGHKLIQLPIENDLILIEPFKLLRELKDFDRNIILIRRLLAEIPRS